MDIGYKLHITASTGSFIVPLSANFTQWDEVQDNQMHPAKTYSLPQGVCPVAEIHNQTSSDRLQLIHFYES